MRLGPVGPILGIIDWWVDKQRPSSAYQHSMNFTIAIIPNYHVNFPLDASKGNSNRASSEGCTAPFEWPKGSQPSERTLSLNISAASPGLKKSKVLLLYLLFSKAAKRINSR